MLQGITEINGTLERRPGGHNWPDMEVVIDTAQTKIEDDEIYLLQIQDRDPVIKRCRDRGANIFLMPAVATVHDVGTVELFGKRLPIETIEFSDNIYKRYITVCGRVVGLWAGKQR